MGHRSVGAREEHILEHIEAAFEKEPNPDTEQLAKEVFGLLARRNSPGEIDEVKHMRPADVRALWPAAVR